jgi:hypothetical protein
VTLLASSKVPEESVQAVMASFGEEGAAALPSLVIAINTMEHHRCHDTLLADRHPEPSLTGSIDACASLDEPAEPCTPIERHRGQGDRSIEEEWCAAKRFLGSGRYATAP